MELRLTFCHSRQEPFLCSPALGIRYEDRSARKRGQVHLFVALLLAWSAAWANCGFEAQFAEGVPNPRGRAQWLAAVKTNGPVPF